ncbi:MAG: aspartate kinase [Bacteroidia bacterium]|nr:aspartate kinase [Bacteroidia bacterium]
MKVMKFGGASVKNADAIRNVANIIVKFSSDPCLIVVSAIDKTTNHLEDLAHLARDGKQEEALEQFRKIRRFHVHLIHDLFGQDDIHQVQEKVRKFLEEIERIVNGILLLEEFPPRTYDRIVSYGELISTVIVAEYIHSLGHDVLWTDARLLVKTDATYKQAGVIWTLTEENIRREVLPQMKPGRIVITQGFIGSTTNGRTTTLGREGSDYTGSIFAHCLGAESLTVWKDVPGVLNGDPRIRENTVKIDNLSYEEAVEMTFYGASVIHPKTIKPIFNKSIPLLVKCFLDIEAPGTTISAKTNDDVITSYIVKKEQAFIRIKPKDFSFMEERLMQEIFDHLYKSGVKVNLVQNSAISLMLCVDNKQEVSSFESLLLDKFDVEIKSDLKLYTMINFSIKDLKETVDAVMVQQHDNKLFVVK